ncbi:MAG: hypothetical protein LBU61_03620 [Coriobacteriales bacterium]|jgi:hypothetical protein|nr:hypothetical protein [Coriobacteriales bacterium]
MKKHKLITALSVSVVCLVLLVAIGLALSRPIPVVASDQASLHPVNENGQTYGNNNGIAFEQGPDLIEVKATNGEIGYISRDEMLAIDPKTPEEIEAFWDNYYNVGIQTFIKYVFEQTGVELDASEVDRLLHEVSFCTYRPTFSYLSPERQALLIDFLPEGYQTESFATKVLLVIWKPLDRTIPVYKEDGKTIIGEFPIK